MYMNRKVSMWDIQNNTNRYKYKRDKNGVIQRERISGVNEVGNDVLKRAGINLNKNVKGGIGYTVIEYNEMYWRKAYAIDDWLLSNACYEENARPDHFCVSEEKLIELRDMCKEILDSVKDGVPDINLVKEKLPEEWVINHFDDEYKYYVSYVRKTYRYLSKLDLENNKFGDFWYERSY